MSGDDIWVHIPYQEYKKEQENWEKLYVYINDLYSKSCLGQGGTDITLLNILYKMDELKKK